MKSLYQAPECGIYTLDSSTEAVQALVATTPETRAICNDPLLYGTAYTSALKAACARVLKTLIPQKQIVEKQTSVLHLLRGGLNFGLREALGEALGWNAHSSTFLSAQRRRTEPGSEAWEISECEYRKTALPQVTNLVLGDVVASGASLRYGIEVALEALQEQEKELRSILFFTIGGPRSEEVFRELAPRIEKAYPNYQGTTIVYFEGRFPVATPSCRLSIKITGTDLLRQGDALAPEFLESQHESPMFPVERCTIYDAGSRAFEPKLYLEDVLEYWQEVAELEETDYKAYAEQRCPAHTPQTVPGSLQSVAGDQIRRLQAELAGF